MEQYEKAETALREVLRLKSDHADGVYLLAVAQYHSKQFESAATTFQQAAKFKPDDAELYHYLGSSYARLGRGAEARQIHAKLLKMDKERAEQLYVEIDKAR
jgi:Flp pilus assembly protein TadD